MKVQKVLKSDFVESRIKYDNGFKEITLSLYLLDILRIMEILKCADNMYYYNELRWFVDEVAKADPNIGIIDFNRVLPRIKLKEKKVWEIKSLKEGAKK
jgi:hypothetical protein